MTAENTLSRVDIQIRVAETSHQENVMMQILAPNRHKLVDSPAFLKYKGTSEQVSDLTNTARSHLSQENNTLLGILGLTKQQWKPSAHTAIFT